MFKIARMCEHDDGVESHCHWKTSGYYSHYGIEPQVAAACVVEPYVVLLLLELLQLTDVYYALHGGNGGVVLKWCRWMDGNYDHGRISLYCIHNNINAVNYDSDYTLGIPQEHSLNIILYPKNDV